MKTKLLQRILILALGIVFCRCSADTADDTTTITSGRVNTSGKYSFKYGKLEASIKLPTTANGLWPAFWMLGSNINSGASVGWPRCGEIDIIEMGSKTGIDAGTQDRLFTGATHWGTISPISPDGSHPNYAITPTNTYSLQDDDFHLFTLKWDENYIRMYLDIDKYPTVAPYYEIFINEELKEYFTKDFFILFNLAVGGDFPQIYNINQVTALNAQNNYEASMYVDFVRVYSESNELLWEDNFDSSTIDANKWNIEENSDGGGNNELQTYTRENVAITVEPKSGKKCLTLTAKREE
ncbi:MAG: family 16 glycosylhydrolase [Prevotellaceae bacterium]|jgi:beta-glucanase (GH16 family)|nr:family 16 glycosylhydrolase [Prevotellaceae bacterium]